MTKHFQMIPGINISYSEEEGVPLSYSFEVTLTDENAFALNRDFYHKVLRAIAQNEAGVFGPKLRAPHGSKSGPWSE
jgi:hypothetical protein